MPRILTPTIRKQLAVELRYVLDLIESAPYDEFPITDKDIRIRLAAILQDCRIQ